MKKKDTSFSVGLFLATRDIRHSNPWTTALIIFVMSLTFLNMILIGGILSVTVYILCVLFLKVLSPADYTRLNRLGRELGPVSQPFLLFLAILEKINNIL